MNSCEGELSVLVGIELVECCLQLPGHRRLGSLDIVLLGGDDLVTRKFAVVVGVHLREMRIERLDEVGTSDRFRRTGCRLSKSGTCDQRRGRNQENSFHWVNLQPTTVGDMATAASDKLKRSGQIAAIMNGEPPRLTHLDRLEAESILILRETVAEAEKPVMLYSIGKDSAVMLHLAKKAFFPGPLPFPLLHVDTTWKFRDMYALRDKVAAEPGDRAASSTRIRRRSSRGINPFDHGPLHTDMWKTEGLKQALDKYGFDAAFGGARRDEEKSRAKERIFSFRDRNHRWDPKRQRPELWSLYNVRKTRARASASSRCPTGPSSTCGNISCARRSRSCRSILRPSGRRSSATA